MTDANGKLYEHLEHFPFGEKWYFDIYTISPSVTVTVNNGWAQYTAASNWTAPYTGQTSITPVLNLAAVSCPHCPHADLLGSTPNFSRNFHL